MQPKPDHLDNRIERDIAEILQQYPKLQRIQSDDSAVLQGVLELFDDNLLPYEAFHVRIQYSPKFPYEYPKVWEIGGEFPRNEPEKYHLNGDDSLCVTIKFLEYINTRHGFPTLRYMEEVLKPNLCWRSCVLRNVEFDKKEYGHTPEAIIGAYLEYFEIDNLMFLKKAFEYALSGTAPNRMEKCFCGSTKSYRKCHQSQMNDFLKIPVNILKNDKRLLDHCLYNHKS